MVVVTGQAFEGNYNVWIIHDFAFVAWKHVTSGDSDQRKKKIQLKTMHSEIGGSALCFGLLILTREIPCTVYVDLFWILHIL